MLGLEYVTSLIPQPLLVELNEKFELKILNLFFKLKCRILDPTYMIDDVFSYPRA